MKGNCTSALNLCSCRGPAGPLSHCVVQTQNKDVLEETHSRRSGQEKKELKTIDEQQIDTSELSRVQWAVEEPHRE